MIYDNLDLNILELIINSGLKKEETTTWKIAKKISWKDKNNNFSTREIAQFYNKKGVLVKLRLYNMAKENLIRIDKNGCGKNIFILSGEMNKVFLCSHRFPDGKYYKTIVIKGKDNKWKAFQI